MSVPASSSGPIVVHVGAFDLADHGDLLPPLISATELGRRCGAVVRPFGPFGMPPLDDRLAVWSLPRWTQQSAEDVARLADLVLVGGGEIGVDPGRSYAPFYGVAPGDAAGIDRWLLEGPSAPGVPKVWHGAGISGPPTDVARWRSALEDYAVVAVRDERSAMLLRDVVDFDRARVVPDTALLLSRLLTDDARAATLTSLRSHGRLPLGPYVAVQGSGSMAPFAADHARAVHAAVPAEWGIVAFCASPCHGDQSYAEAFADACPRRVRLLGVEASVDAVLATIADAGLLVAVSLHAAITAVAFDRPSVTLDPFGQRTLGAFLELAGRAAFRCTDVTTLPAMIEAARSTPVDRVPRERMQQQIDDHFDELATLATSAASRHDRPSAPPPSMLAAVAWASLDLPPHLPPPCPAGTALTDRSDHGAGDDTLALARRVQRDASQRRAAEQEIASLREELEREATTARDRAGAIDHLQGVVAGTAVERDEARQERDDSNARAESAEAEAGVLAERLTAAEAEVASLRGRGLFRRGKPKS